MIADVRGYTSFIDQRGDEAAARLAKRFVAVAGGAVTSHSGTVLEVRGDEVLAIFDSPREALRAAVALQAALGSEAGRDPELPSLAGVGIDVGEAVPFDGGYRGRALNMAARLCARAGPGEILITPELAHLAGPSDGIAYQDRGAVRLKGLSRPVHVTAVVSVAATKASTALERPSLGSLEFKILGPLDVTQEGRALPAGGRRQRLVLAYLILEANHVVSMDDLIDRVWGEEPPKAARSTIHGYISHLRSAVGAERIEGKAPGYVFHAEVDEVDVLRFERLARRARRHLETDPAQAVASFEEALSLWRGSPLADLAESEALAGEISRLEELRKGVVEDLIRARLALGEHAQVIGELERLIARDPLRERLWAHLMLALNRSGRQADALDAFGRARSILADELGIDPSAELRELHERILKQDPTLELKGRPLRSYRLLEVIGEGAFGVVWRAIDPGVGREVAIKQIHPRLANDPDFVRRFEQEAQTTARLEHPHIVPLYDYWRDGHGAYLVMRLMRGGSVAELLDAGPMGISPAVRLVEQVASALSAAHRRRLVHRDVKPENILLDEDGNAYLSDFGIAEDQEDAEPAPPGWSKLGFRSPEQIRGEGATPRSDIYALGMVLHAMLGGARAAAERSTPALFEIRPDLPRAVADVVERATAADPSERFDDAMAFAEQLGAALKLDASQAAVVGTSEARNPYKGLRPFTEADASDFFGRDALIERLVGRLSEGSPSSRFLAVVGASGSGKSSVVRAGLLPALRAGAVDGSARWFYTDMLPGPRPMEELEAALLRVAVDQPSSLIDALERDERGLERAVGRVLPVEDTELLLVVDQFEEIFTLVDQEEVRARFLESLAAAVSGPGSRLRVVVTIRADFYDRPLAYPALAELIRSHIETVVPLTAEELERAIAGPAGSVGVTPELALVAEVVADVSDQPGPLPLLQYALTETFERREDGILTLEGYREAGGVTGALATRAEQLFTELNQSGREAARQLFLRLVSVGSGTDDTRRLVGRAELGSLEVDPEAMDSVIDTFGSHRLLSFDRDPDSRAPTVEVAHEALLREWGRLRGWIDASRGDMIVHRRLVAEAAEWKRSERDPSFLLRGSRLVQFEGWVGATAMALSADEREYVHESVAAREIERAEEKTRVARERAMERRSRTRLRALVAVLTVAMLVASLLTVVAVGQRSNAQRQERVARARELAAAATANFNVDPERSILLALAAVDATQPVLPEAVQALHGAVAADREVLTLRDPSTANVAWSPDGRLLATGGSAYGNGQSDVLLWDAHTGALVRRLVGHTTDIYYLAFSPDSTRLATVAGQGDDRTMIWDTRTGKKVRTIPGLGGFLLGARFNPDGERVAIGEVLGGQNGNVTVRVVDVKSGKQSWRADTRSGWGSGPAFSPDGSRVAVTGHRRTLLFDASNGRLLLTLRPPGGSGPELAFSPDGSELLTASWTEADVWNLRARGAGEKPALRLLGQRGIVGVDWSSDGRLLATAGNDGTARIWDAKTGEQLLDLAGHAGGVPTVAFNPDGTRLLTGGGDGTARVWDITPAATAEVFGSFEPSGVLASVSYNPDGTRLLTSAWHGPGGLWDSRTGKRVRGFNHSCCDADFGPGGSTIATLRDSATILNTTSGMVIKEMSTPEPGNWDYKLAFSPDGSLIATAQHFGAVALYDASSGRVRMHLGEPSSTIDEMFDVAFSPDGTLLAGISALATLYLWNMPSGSPVFRVQAQTGEGTAVAFSPDRTMIATSGLDGATVWSTTGTKLATMTGGGRAESVAFSPDGKMLAIGGDDGVARIWHVTTGRQIVALSGHSDVVDGVAFSPDGTELATVSLDRTLRVYTLSTAELVRIAHSRLTRGLTNTECLQYLHTSTCPRSFG
jgi:WD40 repeat protein/serine/threonine protein kinase/class 3 adenylate cyclase/DNA-binding winged helix-turn-helix (wHTH) protein